MNTAERLFYVACALLLVLAGWMIGREIWG
jgi:hypothetical protein